MRKIVVVFILAISTVLASGVDWTKDYTHALEKSKALNKPILMLIDRPNCPYCELLKEDIQESDAVSAFITQRFIPLLVTQNDGTYPKEEFIVYGTPTTFFVNAEGKAYTSPIVGYVEKEKYLRYLGMGFDHF